MSTKKLITKTKYATTILVKSKSPPLDFSEVFTSIFFRSLDMAQKARRFYTQIIKTKGISDKDWEKMIEQLDIDRGSYYHMIAKLRGVGLIEKREGVWINTTHYRTWLEQTLRQVAALNDQNVTITYGERE